MEQGGGKKVDIDEGKVVEPQLQPQLTCQLMNGGGAGTILLYSWCWEWFGEGDEMRKWYIWLYMTVWWPYVKWYIYTYMWIYGGCQWS